MSNPKVPETIPAYNTFLHMDIGNGSKYKTVINYPYEENQEFIKAFSTGNNLVPIFSSYMLNPGISSDKYPSN
jgi:hypothetical protein